MIYTSNYKNCDTNYFKTISISGDKGKKANYKGKYIKELAPKLSFWKVWKNNIGKISDDENNKYYIEEYYKQVLSKLDPEEIYHKINNKVLLCYEENMDFCHRHIISAWIELLLDKKTAEITFNGYKITEIERPNNIKKVLENVIREDLQMYNFQCLHAFYLYQKSLKLGDMIKKLEEKTGNCYNCLWQEVSDLKFNAEIKEEEYLKLNSPKILKKEKVR